MGDAGLAVVMIVMVLVVSAIVVFTVGTSAYGLGRHRGLLRARSIVQATAMRPPTLGSMPPERAWVSCCERIAHLLEDA